MPSHRFNPEGVAKIRHDPSKPPFFVRRKDGKPFARAGIWDSSTRADGESVDSCAVITGEAKGVVTNIHTRMPLIVPVADHARWLDSSRIDLVDLLVLSANGLVTYPMSTVVNSPANDDARCTEPVAEGAGPKGSLSLF